MASDDESGPRKRGLRRPDIVYPELSYKIVGALFEVYNELGDGHLEKVYQRAVAAALKERRLIFKEQAPYDVVFKGLRVGRSHLDFLIEDSVVLELKQGDRFRKQNLQQIVSYLKESGKMLAILANFTREGVLVRRLVNVRDP